MPGKAFGFIPLPPRTAKPRDSGLTMVIDKGFSLPEARTFASARQECVDVVKFGWGTSRLENAETLRDKLRLYRANGIGTMPGGTLLEIAAAHGVEEEFLDTAGIYGFTHIEVSSGTFAMDNRKADLIRMARHMGFTVFAEVGKKDGAWEAGPDQWADDVRRDLDAGADEVILEGRESGTCGIYDLKGQPRLETVNAILNAAPMDLIIFEAPQKHQQVHFIRSYGNGVNLGNIAPQDVVSLETLRLGLRGDTALLYHGPVFAAALEE